MFKGFANWVKDNWDNIQLEIAEKTVEPNTEEPRAGVGQLITPADCFLYSDIPEESDKLD